jgi:hypothetical protein
MTERQPALRAGDADRDRIALALRDHLVAGRLTLEEFTERVELAHEAKTLDELEALTRDLPASQAAAAPAARPKQTRWIVAVMGSADRRSRWRLAEQTNVIAIMGGANLDLRGAQIEAPEVTLNVIGIMGGVNIVVPEGVPVEVTGFSIMGGRHERIADVRPLPGAPLIKIRLFGLMGGVNIRSRPAARDATSRA